jgi:hypothetical protein
LPVLVATAHPEVPFCARQLSAAPGVLARRSVLQLGAQIGSYGRLRKYISLPPALEWSVVAT